MMSAMSKEVKDPTIYYGWFVVAACAALTMVLGGTIWSFGVFFKPLESEFGWSRSIISSGYTAYLVSHAISLAITGRLVDRYSPRPILLTGAFLAGLGVSLCSQVQSINQLRLFFLVAGLGTGCTWTLPTSTVQRWFYQRQRGGLALAIVVAGVGLGALIFAPLINYLVLNYGWRSAFLIVGIIFSGIIAASSLVIRRSPRETRTVLEQEVSLPKSVSIQHWTTRRIVTSPSFIAIGFVTCVTVLSFRIVAVHIIPHATDVGISPTTAAAAVGLMGGFSSLGRIAGGLISERISWQKTLAFASFGMGLSMLWLIFLGAAWILYSFVFCFGMCQGGRVPSQVGILGEFFGMRSLGELIGITAAASSLIGAFSPYIAGFVFDTIGSYFWVFIILLVLLLSAGFVATIIKKPLVMPK